MWKPKVIYTDNSLEFGKACQDLSWNHCTSTPHRSETHGTAERAVRRVKEGSSAVLLQSGLDEKLVGRLHGMLQLSGKHSRSLVWWEDTIWNAVRNTIYRLSCPVWSSGRIHPLSAKDQSRLIQFGPEVLPSIFLGFALHAGEIWKGDIVVAEGGTWGRWTHLKSMSGDSMLRLC